MRNVNATALKRINTDFIDKQNVVMSKEPCGHLFCKDFFRNPSGYSLKPKDENNPSVSLLQYITTLTQNELLATFKKSCGNAPELNKIKDTIPETYHATLDNWDTADSDAKEKLAIYFIQSSSCLPTLSNIEFDDAEQQEQLKEMYGKHTTGFLSLETLLSHFGLTNDVAGIKEFKEFLPEQLKKIIDDFDQQDTNRQPLFEFLRGEAEREKPSTELLQKFKTDNNEKLRKIQLNIADQWFASVYPDVSLDSFKCFQKYYSQRTMAAPLNFSESPEPTDAAPNPLSLIEAIPLRPLRPDAKSPYEISLNMNDSVVFHGEGKIILGFPDTSISTFSSDFVTILNEGLALQDLGYDNQKLVDVVNAPNPQTEHQKFYDALRESMLSQQATMSDNDRPMNIQTLIDYARHNNLTVNLSGMNCQNLDFSNKDLSNIDFQKANLQGANLQGANLQGANVINANFKLVKIDATTQVDQLTFTELQNPIKQKIIDRINKYIHSRGKVVNKKFSVGLFKNTELTQEKVAAAKQLILQVASAKDAKEIAAALRDQMEDKTLNKSGSLTMSNYTQCLIDCSQAAFPPEKRPAPKA